MEKAETAAATKMFLALIRIAVDRAGRSSSGLFALLAILLLAAAGLLMAAAAPRAHYRHHGTVLLNDPEITPGIVRTTDADEVCSESTKKLRKPGIQSVYALYGAKKAKGVCCEIDHLISLELGGDNGVANEWPQPYEPRPGAHEKDEVENWLHAEVCAGKMPLTIAQEKISQDWYAAYLEMKSVPSGISGAK